MASLKETKTRIASVKSTLQITAAMKMVAAAKLHRAQQAIGNMVPYQEKLHEILQDLLVGSGVRASVESPLLTPSDNRRVAIVAFSSNSSLCGGFNANAVRLTLETIRACEGDVEVYPLGRKMADALKRAGYAAAQDGNDLVGHPSYEKSAALARSLAERFQKGEISRVVLVYNRFRSASSQEPVAEDYLPFGGEILRCAQDDSGSAAEYILEPDAEALVAQLLPQVMLLKFHAAILDSIAAEQAARTLAMQTASDNAEDLLGELTLEYNKGRQQKITAEILDLLGGASG